MSATLEIGLKYEFETAEGKYSGLLQFYDPKTGYLVFKNVRDLEVGSKIPQMSLLTNFLTNLKLLSELKNDDFFLHFDSKQEITSKSRDRQTYMEIHQKPEHLKKIEDKQLFETSKAAQKKAIENTQETPLAEQGDVCQIIIDSDKQELKSSVEILAQKSSFSIYLTIKSDFSDISVLSVATESLVFIYDLVAFGTRVVFEELKSVFNDPKITKIIHDSRFLFYFLAHHNMPAPLNTFDTSLATMISLRNKHDKKWPNRLGSLLDCLEQFHIRYPWNVNRQSLVDDVQRPFPKRYLDSVRWRILSLFSLKRRLSTVDLDGYSAAEEIFQSYFLDCRDTLQFKMKMEENSDAILKLLADRIY